MVFAARFLIRLASLLPDEVDLRQTGRDVEALASRLNEGDLYAWKCFDVCD
jgi:hypothetical protein